MGELTDLGATVRAWDEQPEWRRAEAKQFTPTQRSNIRSWGVVMPEPPAHLVRLDERQPVVKPMTPLDFARNLDRISRGELVVVENRAGCRVCGIPTQKTSSGACGVCGIGPHRAQGTTAGGIG